MASKSYTLVMEERKKLTETIISNLEKDGLNWIKGWSSKFAPQNATTENQYRGGNKFKLMVAADQRDYDDPRWVTFNQAKEKGWQVKKGSKSVALEKWIFSKKEVDKITKKETIVKLKNPIVNYFRVFNANDIEGIPELKKETKLEKTNEELNDLISNLKKSSECEIKEEKQDRAYYSSLQDIIVLPPQEVFVSQEQYLGTMLHEMGHSTGHPDRLNRSLGNGFGSVDYAKEELRAEISAIFSQKELGIDLKTEHIDNHSAYINSWIEVLKNDPNEIYKASSDAEKITDKLIENYNSLEKELLRTKGENLHQKTNDLEANNEIGRPKVVNSFGKSKSKIVNKFNRNNSKENDLEL
ncbi:zincin-like metallopeptidase domain-containing protein [Psychrilyobacter sp.]|uniref:ArdC family protein n=1 Tax=Psychrilyobacter sp. TaxID=2586924 RepID=UPI003015EDD7